MLRSISSAFFFNSKSKLCLKVYFNFKNIRVRIWVRWCLYPNLYLPHTHFNVPVPYSFFSYFLYPYPLLTGQIWGGFFGFKYNFHPYCYNSYFESQMTNPSPNLIYLHFLFGTPEKQNKKKNTIWLKLESLTKFLSLSSHPIYMWPNWIGFWFLAATQAYVF